MNGWYSKRRELVAGQVPCCAPFSSKLIVCSFILTIRKLLFLLGLSLLRIAVAFLSARFTEEMASRSFSMQTSCRDENRVFLRRFDHGLGCTKALLKLVFLSACARKALSREKEHASKARSSVV